jgi:hypothetical protein
MRRQPPPAWTACGVRIVCELSDLSLSLSLFPLLLPYLGVFLLCLPTLLEVWILFSRRSLCKVEMWITNSAFKFNGVVGLIAMIILGSGDLIINYSNNNACLLYWSVI